MAAKREFRNEYRGLKVLHDCDDPSVNVIAIHGFSADPIKTWIDTNEKNERWNWLEKQLVDIIPEARVWTFGYNTSWYGNELVNETLRGAAEKLLDAIKQEKDFPSIPLIFLAHSFGGIVVLKTLLLAENPDNDWSDCGKPLGLFKYTDAIVFFGTPFRGTHKWFQKNLPKLIQKQHSYVYKDTIATFGASNENLAELVQDFRVKCHKYGRPNVGCLGEIQVSNVGKIVGDEGIPEIMLVTKESATMQGPSVGDARVISRGLERNHFNLHKFGENDTLFSTVAFVLRYVVSKNLQTSALGSLKATVDKNEGSTEVALEPSYSDTSTVDKAGQTSLHLALLENHGEACLGKLSQPATLKSVVAEPSLWALAIHNLQEEKPELIKEYYICLDIVSIDTDNGNSIFPIFDGAVQKALEKVQFIEELNKTSTVRKYSGLIIKAIIASKDSISSAVSLNPYAAIAWTGVSLLLPLLLLNPTQENDAAIKGLDNIAILMMRYRWEEKSYLHDNDTVLEFKRLTIRLYSSILEYVATLLVYKRQESSKKYVDDLFDASRWLILVENIQQYDAECKAVTTAISDDRAKEWRDEERKWQDKLLQQPRQDEEKRHIRMLYSNYEAGKNINPKRISGTCEWFLNHTGFLTWRESQRSSLLWLSADPGCGKSTLGKYLVDRRGEVLTANTEPPTLCYFFFKDGDDDRTDGAKAICALLHQLILQRPHLYRYAKDDFENKNEKFLTDFDALWNIFLKTAEDPSSREIICVLDALDECKNDSREALIAKLVKLYRHRGSTSSRKPILKFLVTSRPEYSIVREFEDVTSTSSEVRLRGEEESEQISREIDLVIRYKVEELGKKMKLSESNKWLLLQNLLNMPHRTYLWLYLTFESIKKKLKLTKDEIAVIAKTIPENVNQAYTDILETSPDREEAQKLLHIILAATRPLTLQEINVALVITESHKSYEALDIGQPDVSPDDIKNICGLFLSVIESRVYLIHQTAREFLVHEESTDSTSALQAFSSPNWKKSFCLTRSNLLLAEICIWYLQLQDFERDELALASSPMENDDGRRYEKKYYFLSYAAEHWAAHFTKAKGLTEPALIEAVAYRICDTLSPSFKIWIRIYWKATEPHDHRIDGTTSLLVGSYFGHDEVVKLLLNGKEVQVDSKDKNGRTPLSWAAAKGHEAVVGLLLEREDVQADSKENIFGRTPLSWAAVKGYEAVVRLLLGWKNVQADAKDNDGRTPLSLAASEGHEAVVKILLEREDVQADSKHKHGSTPLSFAAMRGHEAVVKLLLEREDVQADSKNNDGRTPLSWAAENEQKAVAKLLLKREDVQADSKDKDGKTPLSLAAERGREAVVKLLLEREDVQTDSKDKYGLTPLSLAAMGGHEAVVKLLLEREDVQVDLKDGWGKTPLSWAREFGHKAVVKLLEQYLH